MSSLTSRTLVSAWVRTQANTQNIGLITGEPIDRGRPQTIARYALPRPRMGSNRSFLMLGLRVCVDFDFATADSECVSRKKATTGEERRSPMAPAALCPPVPPFHSIDRLI